MKIILCLSAEAILAFKSAVVNPRHLSSWVQQYPCFGLSRRGGCGCKSKDSRIYSLLPGKHPHCLHVSRKIRTAAIIGGDIGLPTLTPSQTTNVKRPRREKVVAIVCAAVGATLIVFAILLLVYICLMRTKRFIRRTSETGSSVPSPPGDWARENGFHHVSDLSPYEAHSFRQMTIVELEQATFSFSQVHVIGEGGFGFVYKGLLQDGSIVAIKRHLHNPSQYFVQEVENIGRMRHKHLVNLIGYCQESHQQLLVYDYLPNGNVGNYLYGALSFYLCVCVCSALYISPTYSQFLFADSEGLPIGKLNIRQRLSIALGAAKVSKLMVEGSRGELSSGVDCFLDPELGLANEFSQRSDVYSFGVFLLELISGCEAHNRNTTNEYQNVVTKAKGIKVIDGFVDKTLKDPKRMDDIQRMMGLALQCLETSLRRPTMKMVALELELIRERVVGLEDTEISILTLGSELFK
ncbi:hypothetical protein GIB67_027654 [Kingdonia uniflora]|uniref:non-specific serine/threonine protein kinase n=1 Tax=Kingdonia uniflora TaxID=39325 RepID=A0A7J7NL78_9MAGN|nr:hypothetical protein GIB67_027654 [Kingdonia uniflora]